MSTQNVDRTIYAPMPRDQKREAMARTLGEHPDWSDRRLAECSGFSREFVAAIRARMVAEGAILPTAARTGGDGKIYRKAGARKGRPQGPLNVVTRTTLATTNQILSDVFVLAYWAAAARERGLFQAAARQLAARAAELEGGTGSSEAIEPSPPSPPSPPSLGPLFGGQGQ